MAWSEFTILDWLGVSALALGILACYRHIRRVPVHSERYEIEQERHAREAHHAPAPPKLPRTKGDRR